MCVGNVKNVFNDVSVIFIQIVLVRLVSTGQSYEVLVDLYHCWSVLQRPGNSSYLTCVSEVHLSSRYHK